MENKKSKVIRISEKEEKLLNFIRSKERELSREINNAFFELPIKENYLNLRELGGFLEEKSFLDLTTLISIGFISQSDSETLLNALKSNKNILIVGDVGSGKTTFLSSLLEHLRDENILIVEDIEELDLKSISPDINISAIKSSSLSFNDIAKLVINKKRMSKRMVFGDIYSYYQRSALLTAINSGISVLAAISTRLNNNDKDWRTLLMDIFGETDTQQYIGDTFNKNDFLVVNIGRDELNKRKVLGMRWI